MSHRLHGAVAALMLAGCSSAALGCELVASVDRSKISGQGGGTGGDGTGGPGGMGDGGGQGGQGGQGGGSCVDPSQCPGTDSECRTRACVGDACGFTDAPDGTPLAMQIEGDCATAVCDGKGAATTVAAPDDVLDDGNPCTDDTCGPSGPTSTPSAAGTPCTGGTNGVQCDGDGACVECISWADCASAVCQAGACVPATCADGTKNGTETDVDCGGPTCQKCGPGEGCSVDGDCLGDQCSGTSCVPNCSDGTKNNAETGIDCGGPTCQKCAAGETCGAPSDCASGLCTGGICEPDVCGDGLVGGTEQCDDGNTAGGDCCSPTCQLEAINCEIEPNDDAAQADANGPFPLGVLYRGAIAAVGDHDFFAIDLPTISDLKLETFDGSGPSNCVGVDTLVDLYAADGMTILATDDDDGPVSCSLIDPSPAAPDPYPAAQHLAPGRYYAVVRAFDGTIPAYTLRVTATSVCGNATIDPASSEACDDGNTLDGDGCSSICRLEPSSLEVEPDDTCGQANGPFPITIGASKLVGGSISPAGDGDWWGFTIPAYADLKLETFDATGPASCTGIDTRIQAYGPSCATPLGPIKDNGGVGLCSRLSATFDPGMRRLAPGTYYVNVTPKSAAATFDYTLQASVTALCGDGVQSGSEQCDDGNLAGGDGCEADCRVTPACGDDIISGSEQCDDGNAAGGDGCSSTCQWETTAEVEPNGTPGEADAAPLAITGSTNITGAILPSGDLDLFKLSLAAQTTIRAEVFDSSGVDCIGMSTMTLRLLDGAGVQLKMDAPDAVASGISVCPALIFSVPAGDYYLQTQRSAAGVIAGYFLQVKFLTDLGAELEPNDLPAEATSLSGRDVLVFGDHQLGADVDYYQLTLPTWTTSIRAEVIEGDTSESCESLGIDSYLTLFDDTGASLVTDEDDGRGRCSAIDGTGGTPRDANAHNLAAGTYYLQVRASAFANANGETFNYRLAVTVR